MAGSLGIAVILGLIVLLIGRLRITGCTGALVAGVFVILAAVRIALVLVRELSGTLAVVLLARSALIMIIACLTLAGVLVTIALT